MPARAVLFGGDVHRRLSGLRAAVLSLHVFRRRGTVPRAPAAALLLLLLSLRAAPATRGPPALSLPPEAAPAARLRRRYGLARRSGAGTGRPYAGGGGRETRERRPAHPRGPARGPAARERATTARHARQAPRRRPARGGPAAGVRLAGPR